MLRAKESESKRAQFRAARGIACYRNATSTELESSGRGQERTRDLDSAARGESITPHVGRECDRNRFELAKLVADAKQALVQIGFRKPAAHDAVIAALDELGNDATIERLCFEAIRRCKL